MSSQMTRVSPRALGKMKSPFFCPFCYWHEIGIGFRPPFDMPMPGLMHNLDRFEKKLVEAQFSENGVAPKWLATLGCTDVVSFPAKMTMEFPDYDLELVGMPDAVFERKDGSLCLVDYKTAAGKDDDPLLPVYATQLMGYLHLLEASGLGEVTAMALVYFSNQAKAFEENPLELLTSEGMKIPFTVKIHEVEIDRGALEPLLKSFREFADMATPPEAVTGCKNCKRLQVLFDIAMKVRNDERYVKNADRNRLLQVLGLMRSVRAATVIRESRGFEDAIPDILLLNADSMPASSDI
jgi:hypothetical protein